MFRRSAPSEARRLSSRTPLVAPLSRPSQAGSEPAPAGVILAVHVGPLPEVVTKLRPRSEAAEIRCDISSITRSGRRPPPGAHGEAFLGVRSSRAARWPPGSPQAEGAALESRKPGDWPPAISKAAFPESGERTAPAVERSSASLLVAAGRVRSPAWCSALTLLSRASTPCDPSHSGSALLMVCSSYRWIVNHVEPSHHNPQVLRTIRPAWRPAASASRASACGDATAGCRGRRGRSGWSERRPGPR